VFRRLLAHALTDEQDIDSQSGERVGPGFEEGSAAPLGLLHALSQPLEEARISASTWALVQRQALAVTSSRAQSQMASSALKSGL
jgi:hypothetical protein